MQGVPLQEPLSKDSAKFHRHKSFKNKFSKLKMGRAEKQQKMSF